jgi:uncharacterized damage-inducible protein DinB
MARYNHWMNTRLFELCASLPESTLHEKRNAFFGSIYLTLNHIASADIGFFARIRGKPDEVPPLSVDLLHGFAPLRKERERLDAELLAWGTSVTEGWLSDTLRYRSKVDGLFREVPHWVMATHLSNHQTHHRGQVTTLLSQLGKDIGSTDLPFMPEFASSTG